MFSEYTVSRVIFKGQEKFSHCLTRANFTLEMFAFSTFASNNPGFVFPLEKLGTAQFVKVPPLK